MRHYEGMFLLNPAKAAEDWDGAIGHVREILEGAGAQITECSKWDDRKLAYEIDGHARAIYLLAYFNAPSSNIRQIERAGRLSEIILRNLILLRDESPQTPPEEEAPPEDKAPADEEPASPAEDKAGTEAEAEPKAEVAAEDTPAEPEPEAPAEGAAAEAPTPEPET